MTSRPARLAWALWGLSATLSVFVLASAIWTRGSPIPANAQFRGVDAAFVLSFSTVGAIVASRRPRNPVGWLFAGIGLAMGVQAAGWEYTGLALVAGHELPLAELTAWVTSWLWLPAFAPMVTVLLLLFPDGRPLSPRWRGVAWSTVAGIAAATAGFATVPELDPWGVPNPFSAARLSPWLVAGGNLLFLLSAIASMASLAVRFRRAEPAERRQLGWLVYAASLLVVAVVVSTLTDANAGQDHGDLVASVFVILGLVGLPVACAVAVLRYRLFEIDRIVSRTATYTVVVATLAAVYAVAVILFGRVLGPLTGGDDLAVAASTLLVAALFGGLRRRIQSEVDRRFNRSRYDAQRTVDALAARLRDEVDVDSLRRELAEIVSATVHPAEFSVILLGRPS